jgi:hypothetical protein
VRWPPQGATLAPEEAAVIFEFTPPEHQGVQADSVFAVGIRDLRADLHTSWSFADDASGEQGGEQGGEGKGGGAFKEGLVEGRIQEISREGLVVKLTRRYREQLSVAAGGHYELQVRVVC